jgi:hypothetical protein
MCVCDYMQSFYDCKRAHKHTRIMLLISQHSSISNAKGRALCMYIYVRIYIYVRMSACVYVLHASQHTHPQSHRTMMLIWDQSTTFEHHDRKSHGFESVYIRVYLHVCMCLHITSTITSTAE